MSETVTAESDKRTGIAMVFGVLGLVGALVMLAMGFQHEQLLAAWGFAGAMVAGALCVTAVHLSGSSEIINP
ncbi:DUF7525 family protein [Halocatena halophila]|uniref:DUF7525 family protein n=1 Tax=Halocatena halophila TaxID=2814576 RepID=UPI002ED325C8